MPVLRRCQRKGCHNFFLAYPSQIKKGGGKFCSIGCVNKDRIEQNNRDPRCSVCGDPLTDDNWLTSAKKYRNFRCNPCNKKAYRGHNEVKMKCSHCGKTYKVKKYRANTSKFCSRKCQDEAYPKKIKRVCINCGIEFFSPPNRVKDNRGKFCSKKCFDDYRKNRVKLKCEFCGKIFERTNGALKENRGRFCSSGCRYESMSGKNHPSWKGGTSFEPYCPKFNNKFKERVREFWGRKCGICGKSEEEDIRKLSVHHVNYEKMVCCNNVAPLFITACLSCHWKTNHNRNYWEEMLTNYIMIWFDGESYTPIN